MTAGNLFVGIRVDLKGRLSGLPLSNRMSLSSSDILRYEIEEGYLSRCHCYP